MMLDKDKKWNGKQKAKENLNTEPDKSKCITDSLFQIIWISVKGEKISM